MTTQITIEQFAGLVREMRSAQDEYFRSNKTKSQLAKAKALEYRVDKIAKYIPKPPAGEEINNNFSIQKLFT